MPKKDPRSKIVGVILSIIFGPFSWLYVYQKRKVFFWLSLFFLIYAMIYPVLYLLLWLGAIIDLSIKDEKWYKNYSYLTREDRIKQKIKDYKEKHYHVVKKTKSYIIFKVPKRFKWVPFILWTLFFSIFGLVGYIIYYNCKDQWQEETIWIK